MPISGAINSQYLDSKLVNQKYQPLTSLTFSDKSADAKVVQAGVNNRIDIVTKILPINLYAIHYYGKSITSVAANEAGKNPPIVCISSGRSAWLAETHQRGKDLLPPGSNNFGGWIDKTALQSGAVPLWFPYRMTAAEQPTRNVYVFVHFSELKAYQTALKDTDITVIGWTIGSNAQYEGVGFGASRYAATQFFKNINATNGACDKIWLVDDNTIFVNSFPGFTKAETDMGTTLTGLGFKGSTSTLTDTDVAGESSTASTPTTSTPVGTNILQQASLWNIASLNTGQLNFSPYFVTSAEDSSFTSYLGQTKCKWYTSCEVQKGFVTKVDPPSGRLVALKTRLIDAIFTNATPFAFDCVDPKASTLQDTITNDPVVLSGKEAKEPCFSKALEQICSVSLTKGIKLPDAAFKFTENFTIQTSNLTITR